MRSSWWISIGIHAFVVGAVVFASFLNTNSTQPNVQEISFDVIETKQAPEPKDLQVEPVTEIAQKKQVEPEPQEVAKPVERVFGINDDTLTKKKGDDGGVTLKRGNTITKEVDDKVLEDTRALPVPKPEFMVSQMPVLKTEVKPDYPLEAKSKGIEGEAVLKVLIDEAGRVRVADIVEDPGFGMGAAAQKAMYQYEFTPAKIGDTSVAVEIRYVVTFELL